MKITSKVTKIISGKNYEIVNGKIVFYQDLYCLDVIGFACNSNITVSDSFIKPEPKYEEDGGDEGDSVVYLETEDGNKYHVYPEIRYGETMIHDTDVEERAYNIFYKIIVEEVE